MRVFDRLFSLQFTWRDAIDILIVAIIIYWILSLMRGTRAMQVSIGLMLLGLAFLAIDGHLGKTGTSAKRAEIQI